MVVLEADLAVVEGDVEADLVVVGDVQMVGIDHLVVALPTEEECPIVGDAVLGVAQRNQDSVVEDGVVVDLLIGEVDHLQRL